MVFLVLLHFSELLYICVLIVFYFSRVQKKVLFFSTYIKQKVPIIIVFRELGFVADRDILEHITCNCGDSEMMEIVI